MTDEQIAQHLSDMLATRELPDTTPGVTSYWLTPAEIRELFQRLMPPTGITAREQSLIDGIKHECDHAGVNDMRLPPSFGQREGPIAVREEAVLAAIEGWQRLHGLLGAPAETPPAAGAIEARGQEAAAWLVEPNALSHPKMKRQLTFNRPHERGDWTVTPLGRLAGSRTAPDIVDRCDRFTPEEIYAEGRHDQWQEDKALLEAVRIRKHPPLPRLGEGRLYVMSPTFTGEVMTLDAARAYVEADRATLALHGKEQPK